MSLAQIGEFSFIIAGARARRSARRASSSIRSRSRCRPSRRCTTPWLIRARRAGRELRRPQAAAPLQTFASLYGIVDRAAASRRPGRQRHARAARRLVGCCCSTRRSSSRSSSAPRSRPDVLAALLGAWIGVSPTCGASARASWRRRSSRLPFCVGIVRDGAAPRRSCSAQHGAAARRQAGNVDLAAAPRRALVVTLQLGDRCSLVGVPLVAVTQPFLPSLPRRRSCSLVCSSLLGDRVLAQRDEPAGPRKGGRGGDRDGSWASRCRGRRIAAG